MSFHHVSLLSQAATEVLCLNADIEALLELSAVAVQELLSSDPCSRHFSVHVIKDKNVTWFLRNNKGNVFL